MTSNSLIEKLQKSGVVKTASVVENSDFFKPKKPILTDLPILNLAFSGSFDNGLVSGLTIFAGLSKCYKTLLGLYCMKAYLDTYADGIALLYDSEFGITPEYLEMNGIDTSRVIHIPVEHIEQLKFDMVSRLNDISRGDHVFMMIDSIGSLASKKEVEDAIDEKSVADMTRAKSIRSLLRIVTPHFTIKDIPCIAINHIYQTQEFISKTVVSGGTAITYASNQVFIISKSQEKDGTELVGSNFTINIDKSRYVREKSKFVFTVRFDSGIEKYSGLLGIAMDSGIIIKPKKGFYQVVNTETGEPDEKLYREKELMASEEIWTDILSSKIFKQFAKKRYSLGETTKHLMKNTTEEISNEIN